ncbi:MAG TPA: ABC transporter substrate-binding protein [Beijerinckiaceae bacterium]|jgi:NitT/TauT family transport system substrate-binding protein|nr:ABC transporter substrate-binding protein [Beijerinckiaceae bacterium]
MLSIDSLFKRTLIGLVFSAACVTGFAAQAQGVQELRVGVQFGLGYLPFHVADRAGFLTNRMREQGIKPVPVRIVQLAGGPQMNDGLLSGTLEIASGGYTAMMVFCEKTRGAGDKQFRGISALASVPYDLFTVDPELKTLRDIDVQRDKVGVPSIKVSVPAVYLQMAAEQLYGPGKQTRLDVATVSLSQPDGATSLLSGGSTVNSYMFSPPFIQQMMGKPNIRRVWSSNELFGSPATALVSWTTEKFHRENPKLFAAIVAAMKDAMTLISDDPKRAADIYIAAEHSKLAPDLLIAALADKASLRYTLAPEQSMKIAGFLGRAGALKSPPSQWKDLFFPEIHGETGS